MYSHITRSPEPIPEPLSRQPLSEACKFTTPKTGAASQLLRATSICNHLICTESSLLSNVQQVHHKYHNLSRQLARTSDTDVGVTLTASCLDTSFLQTKVHVCMGCQASKAADGLAAPIPAPDADAPPKDGQHVISYDVTATTSGPQIVSNEKPSEVSDEASKRIVGKSSLTEDCTEVTELVKGSGRKRLTVLHFNDVYNIEPGVREPVGGAARLAWKVKSFSDEHPLVVFSGDAYNPSLMSTVTMGKQMVPILNGIGVSVAAVGNHDFDYGVENMMKLNKDCKFPWLMANVIEKATGAVFLPSKENLREDALNPESVTVTGEPLGGALRSIVLDWNGIKVGLAGLVEKDWLDTLAMVDPSTVDYLDFVDEGRRLAKQLKEGGAEVLIAVTHMRVPNDRKLASELGEYHLILGGHDHHYEVEFIEPHRNLMVKSGTDFRDLTKITVEIAGDEGWPHMSWERLPITSQVPEDEEVKGIVAEYLHILGSKMDSVLVETLTELDGRFTTVRLAESNLGNFVCDIWRQAAHSHTGVCVDVALLNSGSLRSDQIHPAGEVKVRDVMAILPMIDETVVLEVRGSQLLQALENGVSQYPKLEGRFPQVSGVRFEFDPEKDPGSRVVPGSVIVGDNPLERDTVYTLATKAYLANGKDGYDVLKECKVVVDEENGVAIPTALKNHFVKMGVVNTMDSTDEAFRSAAVWTKRTRTMKMESFHHTKEEAAKSEICVRHPTSGKWVIAPALEGRITNIRAPAN